MYDKLKKLKTFENDTQLLAKFKTILDMGFRATLNFRLVLFSNFMSCWVSLYSLWSVFHCESQPLGMYCNIKQLLDEVEHDIMNYQSRGLCYLPKPKTEADNTDMKFW